jgi:hypothetical protein
MECNNSIFDFANGHMLLRLNIIVKDFLSVFYIGDLQCLSGAHQFAMADDAVLFTELK